MKYVIGILMFMLATVAYGETIIRPLMPDNSTVDYRSSGYVVERNVMYPTLPGTNTRDYRKPGYLIEGDKVYPMYPGTTERDYRKPALKIGK